MIYNQIVTWTAFAILAMFSFQSTFNVRVLFFLQANAKVLYMQLATVLTIIHEILSYQSTFNFRVFCVVLYATL